RQPFAPRGPDAVLRGDRATEVERGTEDLVADEVGEARGIGIVAVEDEVGVEVAVAGMAEGRTADLVRGRDPLDGREQLRDAGARHADVLHPDRALALEGT